MRLLGVLLPNTDQTQKNKPDLVKALKKRQALLSIAKKYPLAVARLWVPHCCRWDGKGENSPRAKGCGQPMERLGPNRWICRPCQITEQRTSQIEAFHNLDKINSILCSGGNRAGKTQCGAMLAVAKAAGSDEWWVKEWLKLNDLPPDLIQPGPTTVWASALSYSDSLAYVRPKITEYLPHDTIFKNWHGPGRSQVILKNGGRIVSMSADSGREKYQGAGGGPIPLSMVWLDEEHRNSIHQECLMRLVDFKQVHNGKKYTGFTFLTMTPLKGVTWPHALYIENEDPAFKHVNISGLDNPWISSALLYKAVSHMSEEAKASRLHGSFTNQQGVVYSSFDKNIHVIKAHDPKPDWSIDLAFDFGVRNPFCCLAFGYDHKDDCLHVLAEFFQTERTTIQNGLEVKKRFKKYLTHPNYRWAVADPESLDARRTLANNCGIETVKAPKYLGVIDTINLVMQRLALNAEGKPALFIHDNCVNLLKEFRLYRWQENTTGKDKPKKVNDHGLDCLRYQVAFLDKWLKYQS